jgi:hypothetical protein
MTQEDYLKWKQDKMLEEDPEAWKRHEEELTHLQKRMEVLSAVLRGVGLNALMKMARAVQSQLDSMVPHSGRIDDLPDGAQKSFHELEGELMVVTEAVRIAGGWREVVPETGAEESYAFGLELELWPVGDRVEILSLQVSRLQQALLKQKIMGKWRNAKDNLMASFRKTVSPMNSTAPNPLAMLKVKAPPKITPPPTPKPVEGSMVSDAKLVAVVMQLNHRVASLADAIAPLVQRWAYVRLRANMLSAMSVNELIEWRAGGGDCGGGSGGGIGGRGGGDGSVSAPVGEMYSLKELFRQKTAEDEARRRMVDPSVIRRKAQTKGRSKGMTPWLQLAVKDQLNEGSVDGSGSIGYGSFPPPAGSITADGSSSSLFGRRALGQSGDRYHVDQLTEVVRNHAPVGIANGGQCPVGTDLRQKKEVLGWRRMQLRKALTMARQQLQHSQWAAVDTLPSDESPEEQSQRAVARVASAISVRGSGSLDGAEVGGSGEIEMVEGHQWRSLLAHRAPLSSIEGARLLLVYGKDSLRAAKAEKKAKKKGKKVKKAGRQTLVSHVSRARQMGLGVDKMGVMVGGGADDPDGAVLRYGAGSIGTIGTGGGSSGPQTESSALRQIVADMDRVVEEIRGCLLRSVGDDDPIDTEMATIVRNDGDEQADANGFEGDDQDDDDERERQQFTGTGDSAKNHEQSEGVARDGMLMDMLTLLNLCGSDGGSAGANGGAPGTHATAAGSPDREAATRVGAGSNLYWRGGRRKKRTGGWAGGAIGGDNAEPCANGTTTGGSNPALGALHFNPEIEAAAADAARGGSVLRGSYPSADGWSAAAANRATSRVTGVSSAWDQ